MTTLLWTAKNGDTLDLNGTVDGIKVLRGAEGLDAPPVRVSTGPRVGQAGSSLLNSRWEERDLFLPVVVMTSADALEMRVAEIAAAIVQGGTLSHLGDNYQRSLLDVIYVTGMEGVRNANTALPGLRKFPLSFIALDPWWYGEAVSATIGFSATVPFDAATAFDAATGFDGSAPNPVYVDGDEAGLPLTTITGPFTTLQVGLSGGETFALAAPLSEFDTLTVDTYPGLRGPRINGGPVDWSLLTPASRLWELPKGATVLNAFATGDTASSAVTVSYRPRWLTP